MTEEPDGITLLYYLQGKATPEQISNVEQWIDEDNANKKTLLELARIYYAQETQKRISSRDSLKAFNQVKRRIERKKHFEKFRYSILAAACLAGIITLSVFFSYIYESSRKQPNDNNKYKNITVFTNPGMRSVVTLPDGSIAYLNSGSSLSYPQYFTENDYERRISLQGEGYFKVKHNDKLPFIVSVNQNKINIRATGTEFNVQAYNKENNVRVTLVKGSVLLSMKKKDNKSRYTQLKTPQRVSYDLANESISMDSVVAANEATWREGRLVFKDSPLPEMLEKLTHFYNVQFTVNDPVIYSYSFTGDFDNKQLSQILDYLKISSSMDYKIQQNDQDDSDVMHYTNIVLFKKRDNYKMSNIKNTLPMRN
jgi:transmembrane sensor